MDARNEQVEAVANEGASIDDAHLAYYRAHALARVLDAAGVSDIEVEHHELGLVASMIHDELDVIADYFGLGKSPEDEGPEAATS